MMRRIYSTLFWGFLVLSSALLFPVAALLWAGTAPFDPRKRLLHKFTCWWASLYTRINPLWPVSISGRDRIDPDTTYVMVANHLSFLDILVLFRLSTHFKWVSKVENFSVPFVGWNMRLNGYIPLRRGDRESVREMMAACDRALQQGSSIMMFPEGTRSRSGELQAFKPGAFELALRNRVPLLPIIIEGTHKALPKRGYILKGRYPIRITVLDAVPVDAFGDRDARQLAEDVRGIIAAHLGASGAPR